MTNEYDTTKLLCILHEHLGWLNNELSKYKENSSLYNTGDYSDLKSRRDELMQILKEYVDS